jgi:mxaJ protein
MRTLVAIALAIVAPAALAHSAGSRDAGEWFLIALLFAGGAWYLVGFVRVRAESRSGRTTLTCHGIWFAAGWLVIALSLLTPLHALGGRSFAAHMIEHELLMLVAAPLLAWSKPIGVLVWALPTAARHASAALGRQRWYASAWAMLSAPLVAALLQAAAMWLWHAPALFDRALRSEAWHAAQHLSFVFTSILFWWTVDAAARQRRPGVAAFWLFFTSIHGGLLGMLMTFAQSPWYPRYLELGLPGVGGLAPLEDQQLAGVLMWIPGGLVHAIVALAYLGRWLRVPRPALPVLALFIVGGAIVASPSDARELRVCADPNNLPFSNAARQGFENRIIELVADELGANVSYVWWAQRRGNVRETLHAGRCDVIPGIACNLETVAATRPYYRSSYVFVTRAKRGLDIRGFDDERLRTLTIGVQMIGDDFSNTPPAHALTKRGIVDNVRGYMVYGDYAEDAPPRAIVDAVANGEVDLAIVWGPLAGYFAARSREALTLRPVAPMMDGPMLPMAFDICMGVRKEDRELRGEVDRALGIRSRQIRRVLEAYGVPMVGE